uniref:Si:ch211-193l2.10 n=1 Tax=Salarias fasciatus TaxID=181472 RepID=A0A672HLH8_SALFA
MRGLLTTQSQNGYREQIKKEMLTRLAWKSRYANSTHPAVIPVPERAAARLHSPQLRPLDLTQQPAPPLMRPASPQTKQTLLNVFFQGKGRRLYLQRRGHIKPEERFAFPVLSSWEYGWRLGDYTLDYKTPSSAKSSVVKNTFYAKNGVFSGSAETNEMV